MKTWQCPNCKSEMDFFGVTEKQGDKFICPKCYSQVHVGDDGLTIYTKIKKGTIIGLTTYTNIEGVRKMFIRGEIVKILLTGEYGMVIDVHIGVYETKGYITGYDVRLPDYTIVRFYENELAKREDKKLSVEELMQS